MKRSLLNFVHIPKTGGTTFLSILKRNFDHRQILQIDGMDPERTRAYLEQHQHQSARYELLMGHWSLQFERYFADRDIVRILFLRDPLSHFLSTYFYIRKTPDHAQHSIANQLGLEDFLEYRKAMNLDNLQTRHLAGIPTNMVAGTVNFDSAGEEVLQKSKSVLNTARYPFLTEKFDDALRILRNDGILRKTKYVRENVSIDKKAHTPGKLSPSLEASILEVNRFDVDLYRYAVVLNGRFARSHAESRSARGLLRTLFSGVWS